MFEDRTYKRTFYSAPQSVTSLVAAFLEPAITVLTFLAANWYLGEPVNRPELTLCLLVFALTFPGRNRFRENLIAAGVDLMSSWVMLIGILALCGYATNSIGYFEYDALFAWIFLTPVLQWIAVWIGQKIVRRTAARPEARRSAIVVGAGSLGVKVARALDDSEDHGIDFIGYFD
ncbi:MAG TPA: undecaprenyl-phosphate glucose phosphotransferase, partial [Albitalea sp.]|nr:undecaprenyl-phosphate glucose phosphotransferase [Albitalea sp.]